MAFRIVWSETATEDLKEIVRYIAMDNPGAAAHLGLFMELCKRS